MEDIIDKDLRSGRHRNRIGSNASVGSCSSQHTTSSQQADQLGDIGLVNLSFEETPIGRGDATSVLLGDYTNTQDVPAVEQPGS